MKFFDNITWQKVVLLIIVILIITRIVAPDTAEWILTPIIYMIDTARETFGGIQ